MNITKENKAFLLALKSELNNQDNRMTSSPIFQVINADNSIADSFFTNKSAVEYIEANKHNLDEPIIYVKSCIKNEEFNQIIEIIKNL